MALLALNQDDPLFGANMALAAGLLQGNFGAGLQGFSGAMREGRQDAMRKQQFDLDTEVKKLALEKARRDASQEQGLMGLQQQFFSPGAPGMAGTADVNSALPAEMQIGAIPPMAARQPQFDVKGYTGAAVNQGLMNPIEAIKLQQSMVKDAPINKLDVKDFTPASVAKFARTQNYADLERMDALHFGDTGGALVGLNKFTGQPVSSAAKTGNPFSDLLLSDGKGGMSPNSPLINAKSQIARSGASSVSVNTGQKGLDNELKIRSDFRSEPIYKAHQEVQSAHSQITAALKQASPAGDLAGATKLMKILDPGSVVRESELGMAMSASGLEDRLRNYASNVVNGTKLTPTQRKDFQDLADKLNQESIKQYGAKRKEYESFATGYGLDGERILGPAPAPAAAPVAPKPTMRYNPLTSKIEAVK